jgi:hypothetical protein
MRWKVQTKLVKMDGGVGTRWFWWAVGAAGTEESKGFKSRRECEVDAVQRGYEPEDAASGRFEISIPK